MWVTVVNEMVATYSHLWNVLSIREADLGNFLAKYWTCSRFFLKSIIRFRFLSRDSRFTLINYHAEDISSSQSKLTYS